MNLPKPKQCVRNGSWWPSLTLSPAGYGPSSEEKKMNEL
jgi:hypothetical protein